MYLVNSRIHPTLIGRVVVVCLDGVAQVDLAVENAHAGGARVQQGEQQRLEDPGHVAATEGVDQPSFGQRSQRSGRFVQVIKHKLKKTKQMTSIVFGGEIKIT